MPGMNVSENSAVPRRPTAGRTPFEPLREVRFAVVLFGGVSLAVYISGVVQELLRLVRASAPDPDKGNGSYALLDDCEGRPHLSGTERIYRELALRAPGGETEGDAISTRFVIDIISGTSAGGINGIFLAKALADGLDLKDLAKLWEDEAALDKLLHDRDSYEGLRLDRKAPVSLLNSRRMTWKLLEAFQQMEKGRTDQSVPLVDQLDLLVTATDLRGKLTLLRVGDVKTYELHHKRCFHFGVPPRQSGKEGFGRALNPFLAFAARATSSFPLAFEPATLDEIVEVCQAGGFCDQATFDHQLAGIAASKLGFGDSADGMAPASEAQLAAIKAVPFGDGGFLDNKPFTNVLGFIRQRQCPLPVERKLIYVEPSPEHPEDHRREGKPDAFETAYLGVLDLPRRETIREDLQQMKDYNEIVRRAQVAKEGVEQDASRGSRDPEKFRFSYEDWRKRDLRAMIENFGIGYGSYMRLRVAATTDALGRFLAGSWGWPADSEIAVALQRVASVWRSRRYTLYLVEPRLPEPVQPPEPQQSAGHETENVFLANFDFAWQLRRLRFVGDQMAGRCSSESEMQRFLEQLPRCHLAPGDFQFPAGFLSQLRGQAEDLAGQLARIERDLAAGVEALEHLEDDRFKLVDRDPLAARLEGVVGPRTASLRHEGQKLEAGRLLDDPFWGPQLERALTFVRQELAALLSAASNQAARVLPLSTARVDFDVVTLKDPRQLAEAMAAFFYRHFEQYDLISYPLLYGTGGQEGAPVDILRISPEDADSLFDQRHLGIPKLAGTGLAHFAAFCDRRWRRDDRVWGRLDAAERIVAALVPETERRQALLARLQSQIVHEELGGEAKNVVGQVVAEAGRRSAGRPVERSFVERFRCWLVERTHQPDGLASWLQRLPPKLREEVGAHLMAQIDPVRLRDVFAGQTERRQPLEPDRQLDLMRRSAEVLTDLLSAMPEEGNRKWLARLATPVRWLASALTAIFVLAASKSPLAVLVRRAYLLLIGVCLVAVLVLLVFDRGAALYPLIGLGFLLALRLAIEGVARWLSGRSVGWLVMLAVFSLLVALAAYGGLQLWGDFQKWLGDY